MFSVKKTNGIRIIVKVRGRVLPMAAAVRRSMAVVAA